MHHILVNIILYNKSETVDQNDKAGIKKLVL